MILAASGQPVERTPLYAAVNRGVTWSVVEQDAQYDHKVYILHNLPEWQARAIAAILRK